MEKQLIAQKAQMIRTKEDLLALLNEIKSSEIGDKAFPIAMSQLCYHCNPNRLFNRYIQFKIPKKSGGVRVISAPNRGLKDILTWLNVLFQAVYTPSKAAMGFTIGRSVVDNARIHVGQNYILNLDLKDFFPSIEQARVWKRLQLPPFNFPQPVANVVAGLCCMKDITDKENPRYILPQGAPTSPILTNAICDSLDRKLSGLAKRFGLRYSRYADDITFSSMHNVYQEDGEFDKELRRIISAQGFTINEAKTRLQKKGARQAVTGLVVSEKINVARKYVREIRSLLHIWEKCGYSAAYNKFYPYYKKEKGHVKKGEPNLENVLKGKLLYLKMVKGEEDSTYIKLKAKYDTLVSEKEKNALTYRDSSLKFSETMSVVNFEQSHHTTLELAVSESGHKYAYYMRDGKKRAVSLSKKITDFYKKKLQISLCEKDGERFYLIHNPIDQNRIIEQNKNNLIETLDNLVSSGFDLNTLLNNGTI